jgi:hypothetical protein
MKVNELRVGNTIMCHCRGEYKPHTIKSIWYNDEEKLYYVELDNGFQCNVGGISPIPLTKEFFEKNGFILMESLDYYDNYFTSEDMRIDVYESSKGWVVHIDNIEFSTAFCKRLKYVHELQNAYYVSTGKEMEIKL